MKPKKFKVGIIGLGPVGMILALHFKSAGCEVAICDTDKRKLNLIRNEGIELVGKINKSIYLKHIYSGIPELINHNCDILISAVKAYHVDSVLNQIDKGNNGLKLLIAQNGIDIRVKYTSHFDDSRIFRMIVNFAGNLNAPNVVNVTFFNPPNYIGSIDDSGEEMATYLADVLSSRHLETKCVNSFKVAEEAWIKTILNAALSPLCALSGHTMKEAMSNRDTLEIVEQIIVEAMQVAKAEDIIFEQNFVKLCLRYLKSAGDHFPSLAVDIINKRDTEIDYMNGKFVEYGRKHYIKTPINLVFTNIVKAVTQKNLSNNNSKDKYLEK
ncbi:MAG: ketopantoate reductase family protein [Chlorobi bacterium]|nr:ketopantoate reductase family protein [Chlorobiota bacterium]